MGLRQFPFVRILIPFVVGILLSLLWKIHVPILISVVFMGGMLVIHFFSRIRKLRLYRYMFLWGMAGQFLLLLLGNELAYNAVDIHKPEHFLNLSNPNSALVVCIEQPPLEKDKSYKAVATIKAITTADRLVPALGRAIIYFQKDSLSGTLKYGDELIMKNNFQRVAPPKNPDDFDYCQYLSLQKIYATAFVKNGDYRKLPQRETNLVFSLTYWLKEKSLYAIEHYIPSKRESAVAEAMVIGDRDNLSFETGRAFADAGVIHIIVVAGLHVGILYFLFQKVFFFLDKSRQTRIFKSLLIIVLIWGFAFLTGLSGPVLRAATMFSFLAVGKNLRRNSNSYNILACSAFFILAYDPLLILHAGFQLSYLAVFGIQSLSRYINRWLYRTNKIVDHIWKIVAASLSAQLVIIPFTFYYFNQFPSYFLFTNIVVVPIAVVVIWLGVALIVFQWISPVAFILGKLTQWIIWCLNEFIQSVRHLPFAVIHLPSFTIWQALVLSFALIFIIQFFISGNRKMLFAGLVSILIMVVIGDFRYAQHAGQQTFCVYDINRKSCFDFSENGKVFFFSSTDSLDERESFYFNHHWQLQSVSKANKYLTSSFANQDTTLSNQLWCNGSFFRFHNYSIAYINLPPEMNSSHKKIKVDAVIVSGNQKMKIKNLASWYDAGIIVFDSSNSRYKIQRWEKEAAELGIPTYNVQDKGAFIKRI